MKKKRNIKQIIVFYVTSISVSLGIILIILMVITAFMSTSSVLLDDLPIIARTSAQNISSNLHLLTDRMDSLAQEQALSDASLSDAQKQQILDERKKRIEFVWIAAYDSSGGKLYGDELAPASIAEREFYEYLTATTNMTIGEPEYVNDTWQLLVGTPLLDEQGEF